MLTCIHAPDKGQLTIAWQNPTTLAESRIILHANSLLPIRDTLHFGLKCGHLVIGHRRIGGEVEWVLADGGRSDFARSGDGAVFNTLETQTMFTRGRLRLLENTPSRIVAETRSWWPWHRRRVTVEKADGLHFDLTVVVDDHFFGKKALTWLLPGGVVTEYARWTTSKTFTL